MSAATTAPARATVFGLDADEIRPLVAGVVPDGGADDHSAFTDRWGSEDHWRRRFARVAWTTLAEPGDAAAGALVAALGPSAALELVLRRAGADLAGSGGSEDAPTSGDAAPGEATPEGMRRAELEAGIARWTPRVSARSVVRSLEQSARFGIACSIPEDPWWPPGLADLGPCAPLALWSRGDARRIAGLVGSAAIVGSRSATDYGRDVAFELAGGLVDRGVAIVSGGAYGIDEAAHRATLAGEGLTAAVLAGGLDRFYPAGHEELFRRIAAVGVLLAEVPCGVPPTGFRFLQRNRLIAALSAATVVVEAGSRSGSLNTAGHAATLGRPLGAVPGPVTSETSAGCHRLLREYDATCVTGVGEVLELLGRDPESDAADGRGGARDAAPAPGSPQARVLDALRPRAPRTAGEVAALAGLSVREALGVLGGLELGGAVRAVDDGWLRAGRR